MIPAEGGLVDFREGESSPFVGVLDVNEVVVEVVISGVATRRLLGRNGNRSRSHLEEETRRRRGDGTMRRELGWLGVKNGPPP